MNLVLADTEEFRRVKRKATKAAAAPGASSSSAPPVESEEKRTLGLTIVRGAHIISLSVESPPPADPSARLGASAPGGVYISSCRCGNCTTCWTRSSCWIGGMFMPQCTSSVWLTIFQGPAAGIGGPPPGFPGGFPGAPGFGRGAPPPGFGGFPPGFPAGGPPPPGFNPPRR